MWELLPIFAVFYVLGMLALAFFYRIRQNKNIDEELKQEGEDYKKNV
tara:strand:- start:579 stop:719 length:141 start_codon:yes stop_codon:yes gene_type:complete